MKLPELECLIEGEEQQYGDAHSIQARVGNVLVPVADVFISTHATNMIPDASEPCGSREEEIVEMDEATMKRIARALVERYNAHDQLMSALRTMLQWHDGQERLHGLTNTGKRKYRRDHACARKLLAKEAK